MGLDGVQRIARCVLTNLEHLDDNDADARVLVRQFFTEWAPLLEAHLRDSNAAGPINALLAHFSGSWVPLPLDAEALEDLRGELLAASSIGAALDRADDAAPEALTADDVTLDIGNDVDADLLDAFMNDSPPQAAEVTQSLTAWLELKDPATPGATALLLHAKRAAHTLKGSANILGIRGVAKLAHRLEDVLEICESDASPPSAHRARALLAAADCLAQMVAAVAGEDAPPDNTLAVIELLDAARANGYAAKYGEDATRREVLNSVALGERSPAIEPNWKQAGDFFAQLSDGRILGSRFLGLLPVGRAFLLDRRELVLEFLAAHRLLFKLRTYGVEFGPHGVRHLAGMQVAAGRQRRHLQSPSF